MALLQADADAKAKAGPEPDNVDLLEDLIVNKAKQPSLLLETAIFVKPSTGFGWSSNLAKTVDMNEYKDSFRTTTKSPKPYRESEFDEASKKRDSPNVSSYKYWDITDDSFNLKGEESLFFQKYLDPSKFTEKTY